MPAHHDPETRFPRDHKNTNSEFPSFDPVDGIWREFFRRPYNIVVLVSVLIFLAAFAVHLLW